MVWRIAAEIDDGWLVFDGVDVFTVDDVPLITAVRAYWEHDNRRLVHRGDVIFHLALSEHWRPDASVYLRSTVDKALEEEGFIHCSFADQVDATRSRFYPGRDDVVLLAIDIASVGSEIKVEGGFPHIYGPFPVDAVISAT